VGRPSRHPDLAPPPARRRRGPVYAHDKTWDEYAVPAHTIHRHTVPATFRAALHRDPAMSPADFAQLLHSRIAPRDTSTRAPDVGITR
jgi:hypothetical protein